MSKKLIALLLSIVMVLTLFVGCNADNNADNNDASQNAGTQAPAGNDANKNTGTSTDNSQNGNTDNDSTNNNGNSTDTPVVPGGDATDNPVNSKVPSGYISLAEDGVANYRVIFDDNLSLSISDGFGKFILRMKSKTGADLEYSSDAVTAYTEGAKEVLIGNTNRAVSAKYAEQVKTGESLICYDAETQAIIIVAGGEEALAEAVERFFTDYVNAQDRYLAFPATHRDEIKVDFPIGDVTFGDVDLAEFAVVYPEDADLLVKYAALNLVDYLAVNMGVEIDIYSDAEEAREHEFLVGETNRPESDIAVFIDEEEYLLMQNEGKIVMQGNGIYIGAAVGAFICDYLESGDSEVSLDAIPTEAEPEEFTHRQTYCSSVILMIGDGMGFNHIDMALHNELDVFYPQLLDVQGSAITRSQSVINGKAEYTDSAASATALACAYKTINGYLGVDSNNKEIQNVRELAHEYGAQTAVVTTDTITGATPAGFLCHHNDRNGSSVLKSQIANLEKNELVDYTAGSVGDSLTDETRKALKIISDASDGNDSLFLMVEGAYIDKVSHNNDYGAAIKNVIRFNDAIAYSLMFAMCHPGTAVIVTADHECGGLNEDSSSRYGYKYTSTNHTNRDVPVYAFGPEVEVFDEVATENIDIARFIAMVYGDSNFGQSTPVPPRK